METYQTYRLGGQKDAAVSGANVDILVEASACAAGDGAGIVAAAAVHAAAAVVVGGVDCAERVRTASHGAPVDAAAVAPSVAAIEAV